MTRQILNRVGFFDCSGIKREEKDDLQSGRYPTIRSRQAWAS